jgi:hypothetical protein
VAQSLVAICRKIVLAMGAQGQDRRRYPRIRADFTRAVGWVEDPDRLDREAEFAEVVDLGIGGIRFHCADLSLQPGHLVEVTFTLGDRPATVVGKVIRANDLGSSTQEVAVEFVRIDPETLERFRELTEREQDG